MKITINDTSLYETSQREVLDNGYLLVPGRVARAGIQEYLASELGLTDREPNEIVRVNRPESSVFDESSLATYTDTDVTIDHPAVMVDTNSYRENSVGHVRGAGTRDGNFVNCNLIIKDAAAIEKINRGTVQLSAGYTAVYDESPADADHDFIQTDIKINHIAVVQRARAGAQARLFDKQPGGHNMSITVVLDAATDRSVQIEDKASATLVADTLTQLRDTNTRQQATIDAMTEKLDTAAKDSSDSIVKARVKAIADATVTAKKIAGSTFSCDSLHVPEIQRAALMISRPKMNWADKSDIYVETAFDQAEELKVASTYDQLAKDASNPPAEVKDSPYENFKKSQANKWQKTAGLGN